MDKEPVNIDSMIGYNLKFRQSSGHIVSISEDKLDAQLQNGAKQLASLAPMYPEWLGDRYCQETHGLRFPYVVGSMANGITTSTMVIALAKASMLGFFLRGRFAI